MGSIFWGVSRLHLFFRTDSEKLDAFWDVLSKECPASKVTVVGANRLPAAWKNSAGVPFPEMIRRILQRNQEFREKFNEPFDYEFVDA